ncbi:unnamed protein product [Gulo gulo]|uniref:Uncharacterized protein n=1 Tax=Gulo gulo TaxID=48420 RepID=A0A9X9LQM4_GULGU|nr:unnamed protein product [Gulo gulo]
MGPYLGGQNHAGSSGWALNPMRHMPPERLGRWAGGCRAAPEPRNPDGCRKLQRHEPPTPRIHLEETALLTPGSLTLASGTWEYCSLAHAHVCTHEKAGRRGCVREEPGVTLDCVPLEGCRGGTPAGQPPGLKFVWHQAGDTSSCPLSTQGLLPLLGKEGFSSVLRRSPRMLAFLQGPVGRLPTPHRVPFQCFPAPFCVAALRSDLGVPPLPWISGRSRPRRRGDEECS